MVQIQQRVLIATVAALALSAAPVAGAARFYDDDPLWKDPPPLPVTKPHHRKINEYYDFFRNTFWEPQKELHKTGNIPPSQAVNTLGEVPDSAWFTNRVGMKPMSTEELVRGPGITNSPSTDAPWKIVSAKNEGITPGFVIEDSKGRRYVLKFDPKKNPEMASAADVIGSKLFYALGYNVPENYIVNFTKEQLQLTSKSIITTRQGTDRPMDRRDVDDVLRKVPRDREGRYRGLASLYIAGEVIGPFRYHGVRTDDPNDVVLHENRRDLRGLWVFAAWLNHTDSKSINSLDTIVEENGVRYIKHYLIDFGAILGSDSFEAKSPRAGNVYLFDFKPAAWQFLSLGLYVPEWMRADYPDIRSVGHFEYVTFDPEQWKSNYPNPAFDLRTPGDTYWAAKKLMAFTDEQIRAVVETGEFSDPRAVEWLTKALVARRDKIGRAFFNDVLPLDDFRIEHGELRFDDLAVKHGFAQPRNYSIQWFRFDNDRGTRTALPDFKTVKVPAADEYVAGEIRAGDPAKTVVVYLRNRGGNRKLVGIDRTW